MKGIAVRCLTPEQQAIVIDYVRKGQGVYKTGHKERCINFEDGCHCDETHYTQIGFTIISFEQFEEKTGIKKAPDAKQPTLIDGQWYVANVSTSNKPNWWIFKFKAHESTPERNNVYFSSPLQDKRIFVDGHLGVLDAVRPATPAEVAKWWPDEPFALIQEERKNPHTTYPFQPGGIYVGSWGNNRIIFKTKTGVLSEYCWFINANSEYVHRTTGCCTSPDILFRDATPDEKIWLEACIAAGKTVPKKSVKSPLIRWSLQYSTEISEHLFDAIVKWCSQQPNPQKKSLYTFRENTYQNFKEQKYFWFDGSHPGTHWLYGVDNNPQSHFIISIAEIKKLINYVEPVEYEGIRYAADYPIVDNNFAYYAEIVDCGGGMHSDDIGKQVKVLKLRPDGAIANDYDSYNTYVEFLPHVNYTTNYSEKLRYGRCSSSMLRRMEGTNTVTGTISHVESKTILVSNDLVKTVDIAVQDNTVHIKVPTSPTVRLKNTDSEVKIKVNQSKSIKIN